MTSTKSASVTNVTTTATGHQNHRTLRWSSDTAACSCAVPMSVPPRRTCKLRTPCTSCKQITLHFWMASHLDVAERLEYIQYSFNSMISQTRKPDSIWLSVSCLSSFVPQVRLMLQYFERVARSHNIDIYIFLQPQRLMQFEHYHHIWKEFNQNKVRYPNCYITFSDDDDINGPASFTKSQDG